MSPELSDDQQLPVVRLATGEDLAGVTEVFVNSFDRFPRWEVSEGPGGFTRWLADPTGSPSGSPGRYAVVSDLDGMIVGAGIGQFRGARLHGRQVLASSGPWGAMHPIGRGRGFYAAQRSFKVASSDFSFGFSMVAQVRHLGDQEPGRTGVANPWTVLVFVQNPLSAARHGSGMTWPLRILPYAAVALRSRRNRKPATRPAWNVAPVDRCDERFDDLYARAVSDFDIILGRTHQFLNYRYLDNRGGYFSILAAQTEDGDLLGYAAVTVDHGRGHIADLLVLPDRPDVTRSLIDASLAHCASLGSSGVECTMMLNHPYTAPLLDAGFLPFASRSAETSGRVGLRGDNIDTEELRAFAEDPHARIHLTEGDSELI